MLKIYSRKVFKKQGVEAFNAVNKKTYERKDLRNFNFP